MAEMIPDSIPAGAPRGEKVLFNTFRDCCLTTSLCGTRHRVFVVSRLLVRTVRSLLVKLEALESANSQKYARPYGQSTSKSPKRIRSQVKPCTQDAPDWHHAAEDAE